MRIQLANVSKRFGKVHALRDIELDLPAGARIALIGPNGSGKTTLMRVLLGLVHHHGQVLIDGGPARAHALAPRIAYVPQIAPQMAATCGELVRAVTELRGILPATVREILTRLDLRLEDIAGLAFRTLSGGSKQKLLIALALAARPELLILDEPTASLDAEARGRFFELQRELAGDATLILCSHRLEEIRSLVDHVVALEDGRLIYDGDAASYLAERVGSLVEVRLANDGDGARWLADHGFAAGVNGWWSRSVDRAAKLALVPAALDALGVALAERLVRDIDLVEHRAGGRA